MNDTRLYAIGEVARRTGLSVSAIRFYSDQGIVVPAEVTAAGHRLYDVHAIARLEFVSTLRELDAGLDDVRRLLDGRMTLTELATAHLSRLDDQARRIRSRRAVLRTIARQHTEADQVILMHKLVGMSDEERDRLFDDFWNEISEGLEVSPEFLGLMRNGRLVLPDEPSTEQLEAWIELANLLQDADFRSEVKKALRETFSGPAAAMMTSAEMVGVFERGSAILVRAQEAQQAGEPADSPLGREIAGLHAAHMGEITEIPDSREYREKLAADVLGIERMYLESIEEAATSTDPYTRYQSLVATIDGTAKESAEFMPFAWLSAALKASASPSDPVSPVGATHECPPHGDVLDA
jgi:DNA-binding transcriptional MerR regulator